MINRCLQKSEKVNNVESERQDKVRRVVKMQKCQKCEAGAQKKEMRNTDSTSVFFRLFRRLALESEIHEGIQYVLELGYLVNLCYALLGYRLC
jgi:hypothetical protein